MKHFRFFSITTWAGSFTDKGTIKARSKKDAMKKFRKKHPRMDRVVCIQQSHITSVPTNI